MRANMNVDLKVERQEDVEWLKLLCRHGSNVDLLKIVSKQECIKLSIMEFRRLIHQQKLVNVSLIELNTAYINKDYAKVHNYLEMLFLEIITKFQFDYIMKKVDSIEHGIIKLYNRHNENVDRRILTITLTLK